MLNPLVIPSAAYSATRAKDTPEEREDVEGVMRRAGCRSFAHLVDPETGVMRSYGYPSEVSPEVIRMIEQGA